ncbi:ACT domain-containing protein ACR12-like [Ananas comosus]|uniref:ACT domain-containing protein ACR n=2 Tax=Ananas comosus TaxID=4615 RepID=A0A199V492_ANACO|nr:ACT domain-containing protein ACR12-like [Ananas comosus]OAY71675.1 ACT domain-containing protein ACR12 [Ananas comosus]
MALASFFTCSHPLSSSPSPTLPLLRSRVSTLGFLRSYHAYRIELGKFSTFLHGSLPASGGFSGDFRGIGSQSSINSVDTLGSSSMGAERETDSVPMPIVLIDQDSDSDATIVQLSFGDRLGALLDTMKALKDLGLDVTKGTVTTEASVVQTKFFIMRRGRKVENPDMLEKIRLTIIGNLLKYHPESSEKLAMGEVFGIKPPEKKLDVDVATQVLLQDDGPKRSLLYIETADRPGLLLEIIKIITDINIDVESAEIDTEGLVAKDKFHVSYRGAAIDSSLSQVLTNCLRYYLRRPETEEDSY